MTYICGIDEAGRGSLAGRVYAAAVILPDSYHLPGLTDSKMLSPQRRTMLAAMIRAEALAHAVAWAEGDEVEALGIDEGCFLAMRRAVEGLSPAAAEALVDGKRLPGLSIPARAIVRGDLSEPSISAASILAKTERDKWITAEDERYPGYGFAGHKGYGTPGHFAALDQYGACALHRPSFLRKWRERHNDGKSKAW